MKQFFDDICCAVGLHAWEARYVRAGACAVRKTCVRCTTTADEVRHAWGEWEYREPGSCATERRCTRCGVTDEPSTAAHTWGEWEGYISVSDKACANRCTCTRCGAIDWASRRRHRWGEPFYRAEGSCDLLCRCEYCGTVRQAGTDDHQWSAYSYRYKADSCELQRSCLRCGVQEEPETPAFNHKWDVWQYEAPTSCRMVCFCRRCHERAEGEIAHQWSSWRYHANSEAWERTCQHCGEFERTYRDPTYDE
jgi:hypothetical protein